MIAPKTWEVPTAGIVQNIASDLQMLNAGNGGSQGQHSSAELSDVFIAGAFLEFDQNVVLQHSDSPL